MVASCSDDKTVKIWKKKGVAEKGQPVNWHLSQQEINLGKPLSKVSWSQVGNVLAVSDAENSVHLFNEQANGEWVIFDTQRQD